MRHHGLLGLAFWPAISQATRHFGVRVNSSSSSSTTSVPIFRVLPSSEASSSATTLTTSELSISSSPASLITTTLSTTGTSSIVSSLSPSSDTSDSTGSDSDTSTSGNTTRTDSAHSTQSTAGRSNTTTLVVSNSSTSTSVLCTGCVLEAINPTTITYNPTATAWQSVKVTVTVFSTVITYMVGTSIDTVVTEYQTRTQNISLSANETLISTTPSFTWVPVAGTTVTLKIGPTYVAYTDIWGGLDFPSLNPRKDPIPQETESIEEPLPTETNILGFPAPTSPTPLPIETEFIEPEPTCDAKIINLPVWPTETTDYSIFIQTYQGSAPYRSETSDIPITLPAALIDYLKANPTITSIFNGSDIASCTLRPTSKPVTSSLSEPPAEHSPPPFFLPTTSTYISKTYESTSTHITKQGCLRCDKPGKPEVTPETPGPNENITPPVSKKPDDPPKPPPKSEQVPSPGRNGQPTPGNNQQPTPGNNQPQPTPNPQPKPNEGTKQRITVGDSVIDIRPAQPTHDPGRQQNDPNPPPQQSQQQPAGVVIGSQTLTPGQTTTINGVQVIVPTQDPSSPNNNNGNNNNIVIVDGNTITVNPAPGPTPGPPILTVGQNTITANPEGNFVIGTQTLSPGGSPVTVDGSTLSLGHSGTIAVINGETQTLENAAPLRTSGPPVLTVDGKIITATIVGGTTAFVLAPGQTLTPGGVLTVDGTTISMPVDGSGSTVVVNGVTSTLDSPNLPVITIGPNNEAITASIQDGTTAFVLAPGKTLTPGGQLIISGTTFSMPESASGSVVVINGVTSTLSSGGDSQITSAPDLTLDGQTISATVRDGTTEYDLGDGTTLRPGEVVTIDGTAYSLDPAGTALIVNGRTSSIPTRPASNSASTTKSVSTSEITNSSTSTERDPGNFIASGIGVSSKAGAVGSVRRGWGVDLWVEGVVMGVAGWALMLL